MKTRVQRWGNSLAIRIPIAFARQVGLDENSPVDLTIDGDRLVLEPSQQPLRLEDLLAEVTDDNIHQEVDWGMPAGHEAW